MELTDLKGIGEKSKKALEQKGVFSLQDLSVFLPSGYYNFCNIQSFEPNKKACVVQVTLLQNPETKFAKGLAITRAKAQDKNSNCTFTLVWYNQRYAKSAYKAGESYIVYGNCKKLDLVVVAIFPESKKDEILGMYPVYKKTGISRSVLQSAIFESQRLCPVQSVVPQDVQTKMGVSSLAEAYQEVHCAKSKQELQQALLRIELEKAVKFLLGEGQFVQQTKKQRPPLCVSFAHEFLAQLPFSLTDGQKQALFDVLGDFQKSESANRLVMGEVGCGKTLVALLAGLVCAKNGFQVAFLAPTELLARQHFDTYNKYFGDVLPAVFLSSSDKNRKQTEAQIASGTATFVFGTHVLALGTKFSKLGLVVIDEQQRFGVELRAKLTQKSVTGDTISLSATPIPRSVLLALSGVLSASQIKERPMKMNVTTHFVGASKEGDMWNYLKTQQKVFVVCPRIEEADDPFAKHEKSSVTLLEKKLCNLFGEQDVLRVDGKMPAEKQKEIMQQFAQGPQKLLVATTVIEVGVDVPNASAMVICGADRFGLSSLHQLRGRIGRNGCEAHCFVLCDKRPSDEALSRLTFFKEHNNGFEIAEFDFKTRGAGDMFGTRQSGENVLAFSAQTLQKAKEVVAKMRQKQTLIANN